MTKSLVLRMVLIATLCLFGLAGRCLPVDESKAAPTVSSSDDDATKIFAAWLAARKAMDAATGKVATDQSALTASIAAQAAAKVALDKATSDLAKLIGPVPPIPPPPPPPPAPTGISLTAIMNTTGCPACEQSKPVIDQLQKDGYTVNVVYADKDPTVLERFKPVWIVPTYVGMNGDKQIPDARMTGFVGFDLLKDWVEKLKKAKP